MLNSCSSNKQCELCGSEENLVDHHIRYSPPEKVIVCQKCHEKIHGNIPVASDLNLKMRQYDMLTKVAVMNKNWVSAFKRTFGMNPIQLDLKAIEKEKKKVMKDVKGMLKSELKKVEHIKGLGPRYLAGLLAHAHPNRFPSLRKFLVYCGYKQSAKVTKRYSRKVCGLVHQIVVGVTMHKDKRYYPLYLMVKKDLTERYPQYSKGKIHGMTQNRVGTFLLKEIYEIFKDTNYV